MLTRGELLCLTAGLAVGALAGANSEKVKSALSGLLELATEGIGHGYAAAVQKVAEHVEGLQDAAAAAKANSSADTTAAAPAQPGA